mmetsp:Transcript_53402/g.60474  ORF Transcript_53402/g.60474 Transcript_53402/m.60474 type:complete len:80 (-) Transcript_53402:158-397(-)
MHRSINRDPRHDVNINKDIKIFERPYFKLRLQSFQSNISISKVVVNYLFSERYNRYKQNTIKSTTRTVLWNIASTKRVK